MGKVVQILTRVWMYSFNDTDMIAIPKRWENMFILIFIVFLQNLVGLFWYNANNYHLKW